MKKSMIFALVLPVMMISLNIFAPEPLDVYDAAKAWAEKGEFSKLSTAEQRAIKDVLEDANRYWRNKKMGEDEYAADARMNFLTHWPKIGTKAQQFFQGLEIIPNATSKPEEAFEKANAYLMAVLDVIISKATKGK